MRTSGTSGLCRVSDPAQTMRYERKEEMTRYEKMFEQSLVLGMAAIRCLTTGKFKMKDIWLDKRRELLAKLHGMTVEQAEELVNV